MFDYRYHALSLAAVLLALAVGVVLGVAIGDANLVSSAKEGVVRDLRGSVSSAQQAAAQLRSQLATQSTVEEDLYELAVNGQLAGKSIGLIFLGNASDQVDDLVRSAITPAGGQLALVGVVHEPLNLVSVAGAAAGSQYTALDGSPIPDLALVAEFGRRIGIQFADGGQLIQHVRDSLFSQFNGALGRLDGVVVLRNEPASLAAAATPVVASFENGLMTGLEAVGIPVVGVELTSTMPSQVPWYASRGMSSVDDVDALVGRAALAFVLGGEPGTYGVKSTADSLLPQVLGGTP